MKKPFLIICIGILISMSSCYQRLCPTYTTTPNDIEKFEKASVEKQEQVAKEKV